MSIPVTCSKCRASFRVKDEFAGKRGKCPHCEETVSVPATPPADSKSAVARKSVAPTPTPATPRPAPTAAPKPQPAVNTLVEGFAADHPGPAISEAELLAAFHGHIEPVHSTWTYRLALVLVGAVMLLLPVIYMGIICLVGYGMYLHAIHDVWVFQGIRGRGAILALIFYLGVLFAGVIAVLFMIKPFFARSANVERRRSLTRKGEPLLFAFVDRICDAVGAARPRRIDVDCQVNASASFRRGFWSMIVGGDMVLTIGLSLVAGMSVQQFAGVLAHEFGHFSQGLGMRMSYLIRTISFWFTRVVYDRDEWDQRLEQWAESADGRIGIVLQFARLLVWCSRRVLWVLMILGHAVSGYLLRQMEFDADRFETRLCGSASFEQSTRRLGILSVAYQGALADLENFYREGRLGDNSPRLVIVNAKEMPADVRQKIDTMVEETRTGIFDTHPCDKDRILNARRENAPGVFHDPRPATALFTNFDDLGRNATWDFYRGVFGPNFRPTDMHPIDDLLARQGRDIESRKALDRFFQGAFTGLRVLPLPADIPERDDIDAKAIAAIVRESRAKMLQEVTSFKETLKTYTTCDTQLIEVDQAQSLLAANIRVQPKTFSVPLVNTAETARVAAAAYARQTALAKQFESFESAAARRIAAALVLLRVPQVAKRIKDATTRFVEADRLLPVLAVLRQSLAQILELRNSNAALTTLVGQIESNQQNVDLFKTMQNRMQIEVTQIRGISERLASYRYPLDHAKGDISITDYAVDKVPQNDDLPGILTAGGKMLENLSALHVRMCGRLAATAEAVETVLGLPLLPEPEKADAL